MTKYKEALKVYMKKLLFRYDLAVFSNEEYLIRIANDPVLSIKINKNQTLNSNQDDPFNFIIESPTILYLFIQHIIAKKQINQEITEVEAMNLHTQYLPWIWKQAGEILDYENIYHNIAETFPIV